MCKFLLTASVCLSCLSTSAQQFEQPELRHNLPGGVRVFVSQSSEATAPDIAAPPLEEYRAVPEELGQATPIPAPPISENGDAKDTGKPTIYTPMPVEDEAFEPQDPFLYRGNTVEPFPIVESHFDSYSSEVVQNFGDTLACTHTSQHCCAPRFRRCPNDDCSRMFTAYVAGIFLRRSNPDSQIQFRNPRNPTETFDASSFDFDLAGGIEAGFTAHRILHELDLDIRYFSVGNSTATSRDRFWGNITQVNMQTPLDIRSPRDIKSRYSSGLSNVEANLRYRYGGGWNWTTLVAGFRFLSLDESMNTTFTDPNGVLRTERALVDVDNNLYGCQIGMDQSLCGDYTYSLEGYWRAGIYRNHSDGRTVATAATMMPSTYSVQDTDSQNAFVGEIGVKARYALTDSLNFYGSYQILMLDGVAVASRQLAVTDVAGKNGHDSEGDVVFHGASFGLEYVY